METIYYLYEDHEEGFFYVSNIKFHKETLHCQTCGKSDLLICTGTREGIFKSCQNQIDKVTKMIFGEIPVEEGYEDLKFELNRAKQDMEKLKEAFEKFDENYLPSNYSGL